MHVVPQTRALCKCDPAGCSPQVSNHCACLPCWFLCCSGAVQAGLIGYGLFMFASRVEGMVYGGDLPAGYTVSGTSLPSSHTPCAPWTTPKMHPGLRPLLLLGSDPFAAPGCDHCVNKPPCQMSTLPSTRAQAQCSPLKGPVKHPMACACCMLLMLCSILPCCCSGPQRCYHCAHHHRGSYVPGHLHL